MVWFYTETLRSGGEKSWGYKNLESSFDKLGNYWNIVTISTLNLVSFTEGNNFVFCCGIHLTCSFFRISHFTSFHESWRLGISSRSKVNRKYI